MFTFFPLQIRISKSWSSQYPIRLQQRLIRGDAEALDILYLENFNKLVQYGTRFHPQTSTVSLKDIVQDLFIWIAQNPTKLKEIDNIEVYLYSALKNNIFSIVTKNKAKQSSKDKFVASHLGRQRDYEDSIESRLIMKETSNQNKTKVAQLLSALPEAQQEVIYLRNYVNLDYKEISKIMNLSEQVVRNYSYRAMQKMRKKVKCQETAADKTVKGL